MKKTTLAAMNTLFDFVSGNLGFVLIWAASVTLILKLACV